MSIPEAWRNQDDSQCQDNCHKAKAFCPLQNDSETGDSGAMLWSTKMSGEAVPRGEDGAFCNFYFYFLIFVKGLEGPQSVLAWEWGLQYRTLTGWEGTDRWCGVKADGGPKTVDVIGGSSLSFTGTRCSRCLLCSLRSVSRQHRALSASPRPALTLTSRTLSTSRSRSTSPSSAMTRSWTTW